MRLHGNSQRELYPFLSVVCLPDDQVSMQEESVGRKRKVIPASSSQGDSSKERQVTIQHGRGLQQAEKEELKARKRICLSSAVSRCCGTGDQCLKWYVLKHERQNPSGRYVWTMSAKRPHPSDTHIKENLTFATFFPTTEVSWPNVSRIVAITFTFWGQLRSSSMCWPNQRGGWRIDPYSDR